MVTKTSLNGDCKTITLHNGEELSTQTLIVANGSSHKKLNIPGESEYFGRGVTVCATCDAPFYKDRRVVVVGGGNSAMTEAEHLTHFASHVTVLQIMPEISANDPVKDKVLNHPNVSVICNAQTTRIAGNEKGVTTVTYRDNTRGSEHDIEAGGVFVAIGLEPNTKPYHGQLELDAYGYIVLKNGSATSVPGVFAAGDIADPFYQQAITSAGDGCRAALDAQRYLTKISLTEI
jgi:thioredoxin reductase (NADPH)